MRAGTPALFLRFSRCNLDCSLASHGFDCDTEFESGRWMEVPEIVAELRALSAACSWVILTGGEPALQIDPPLLDALHAAGLRLAVETNGTLSLPPGIDWITVSPKVPEQALRQRTADEVKYVRAHGQPLPETVVQAEHYLISPAFEGDRLDPRNLSWCIGLVAANPRWRLSVQQHKIWNVR